MNKTILYHGSSEIIKVPAYEKGKTYNDYGRGFYCTEHLELAKEWACTENVDGYANQYEIDLSKFKVLNLSEYTILHWLALLVTYRKIRISTPMMQRGIDWLKENVSLNIDGYDVIIGYRADDSYFSFARAFLSNQISLSQLSRAMRLGKLGEQIVLITPKAFESVQFISYVIADNTEYYMKRKIRDEEARKAYQEELKRDDLNGLYMRDILREEMKPDDARLQ